MNKVSQYVTWEGVGNKDCGQGQSGGCKLKYDEVCKGKILKIPAGRLFQGHDCDSPEVGPVLGPGERDRELKGQSTVTKEKRSRREGAGGIGSCGQWKLVSSYAKSVKDL